jgi:hypothetical protein
MLRGRKIEIFWHGTSLHIDDERITLDEPQNVSIELKASAIKFLVA